MCGGHKRLAGARTEESFEKRVSGDAELAGDFGGEGPEEFGDDGHAAADYSDDDFGVARSKGLVERREERRVLGTEGEWGRTSSVWRARR